MKKNKRNGTLIFMVAIMMVAIGGCKNWVEVNGVKWATRNVDKRTASGFAADPSDRGMFYQWNREVGWVWKEESENLWFWDNKNKTLVLNENQWNPTGDDSPNWTERVCPKGWRLPTFIEIKSLIGSGSFEGTRKGVNGTYFVGDGNGKNNKLLFFPFGTLDSIGKIHGIKDYGNIWGEEAYNMGYHFGTASYAQDKKNNSMGFCIRCVKEIKKEEK